jgi:DEAD/DEAH box helicase domain-containing protein
MDALPANLPFRDEDFAAPMPRHDGRQLGQRLQAKYAERITGSIHLPGRPGKFAAIPRELPAAVSGSLQSRGV